MRKISYVFYLVLVAFTIGCTNYESKTKQKQMPSIQKVWIRYTDNTTDTLTIDYWAAKHLELNYRHVLYSFNIKNISFS